MTNWEKAKWVWKKFPMLLTCGFYALVGVLTFFWTLGDLWHHEWRQARVSLLLSAVGLFGAWGLWRLYFWMDEELWKWIDKRKAARNARSEKSARNRP
jgi:hypothetical protein